MEESQEIKNKIKQTKWKVSHKLNKLESEEGELNISYKSYRDRSNVRNSSKTDNYLFISFQDQKDKKDHLIYEKNWKGEDQIKIKQHFEKLISFLEKLTNLKLNDKNIRGY